jgi:hypothetical protein
VVTGLEPVLIKLAMVAAAAAPVVVVVLATIEYLQKWFRKRSKLKTEDQSRLAFSIKANVEAGNFAVLRGVFGETIVQGFYDQTTNRVLESRVVRARKLSPELTALHQTPLVVWE